MKKVSIFTLLSAIICMNTSCSNSNSNADNPLLGEWTTEFGVPPFDKIKVEHYQPALEYAMSLHNQQIEDIVRGSEAPTFENTIAALDSSGRLLTDIYRVFSMIASADITPEMQSIQGDIAASMSAHNDNISLNDSLFMRIETIYSQRESLGLDKEQMSLLEKSRRNFVRSGSLLDEKLKIRLKNLNQELTTATVKFGDNLLADNKSFELVIESKDDLKGLPASIVSAAAETAKSLGKEGKWVFRLNKPSMIPFLTYADNETLRNELYEGYLTRGNHDDASDNKAIINEIVKLRNERAEILGYSSHAEYVLENNMAKNADNVYSMLDQLWSPALERAKSELEQMKTIKLKDTGSSEFASSDWLYYAEKLRKQKYDLDEEMLRPYFKLENVRQGIFELSNRLYGITFRPVNLPIYNEECLSYEVLDRDGSHLAVLYLDMFPRDGKGAGAWCGSFRSSRYVDGERQAPVVSIVCNFTRPSGNTPALLTLDEVTTFFHEFGHALHNFFKDVRYSGVSGVERDFVELPSQIMENWAVEPEMLKKYALHYKTGEVIPDELIEKISNSSLFNQGFATVEYLAASYIDMDIHTIEEYSPIDVNSFEAKSLDDRGLIDQIAPRYHYTYFSHIFDSGYSAGYYGYIWAEVLDKDAFEAFKESGDLFNREVAESFRKNILTPGGIDSGDVMYRNFRGADASIEPLMKARGL